MSHIDSYIPTDFNPGTLHPLKCLWIARKYQNLVAMDQIKSDLDLTHDEATHAISIGMYIHDYIILENMTEEALSEYDIMLGNEAFNLSVNIEDSSWGV
jgi:hypothetical protein